MLGFLKTSEEQCCTFYEYYWAFIDTGMFPRQNQLLPFHLLLQKSAAIAVFCDNLSRSHSVFFPFW